MILSVHADESYVLKALGHGAAGYLLKTSTSDHLVAAVREVAGGGGVSQG